MSKPLVSISRIRDDQKNRRFLVLTQEDYDENGFATGGSRRALVPIDPSKCPFTDKQEEETINKFKNNYDYYVGNKETNTPGWFNAIVLPKGTMAEGDSAGGAQHKEAAELSHKDEDAAVQAAIEAEETEQRQG